MTSGRENLELIKKYLEMYQEDLLKINHRNAGEVMKMRCNISELINQINFSLGNLPEVLAYELDNQYVGMKITEMEEYQKKTNTEICKSLETQLCTTNLPSYILEPIMFGIREIKKRDSK